jgi:hypothetical protein
LKDDLIPDCADFFFKPRQKKKFHNQMGFLEANKMENEIKEEQISEQTEVHRNKLDKCFFGQKSALKIQYNDDNKAIYLGVGKKEEDSSWTWKTAKLKDSEAAEIILLIDQKCDAVSFYHTFKDETTRITITRKDDTTFFRIEDLSKAMTPAELEVLKIILTETIRQNIHTINN